MDKKKYGIFEITNIKNSIAEFEAESFDLAGTILVFKDRHGAPGVVYHLAPGQYVALI